MDGWRRRKTPAVARQSALEPAVEAPDAAAVALADPSLKVHRHIASFICNHRYSRTMFSTLVKLSTFNIIFMQPFVCHIGSIVL